MLAAIGYTLLLIAVVSAVGAEQAVALYLHRRGGIDRLAILTHAAISLWCLIAGAWVLVWGP